MRQIQRLFGFAWSGLGNFVQIGVWLGAFAVTAWAARAAEILSAYAPFSWVAAGICGGFAVSAAYWLFAASRAKWVRTKYDNTMMLRGGMVDPGVPPVEGLLAAPRSLRRTGFISTHGVRHGS